MGSELSNALFHLLFVCEVRVGLHQGSVLSPLLFSAVMDVVSSDARSGLPSELLYANDLVIMAPTMEQLGRRVTDWSANLLGKGLKVNAGKSKVMVGCSWWEDDCTTLESGPVVSVGKEYRQTLFSALYVTNGFTNGAVVSVVVTCRGYLTVSGVDDVMGHSTKLI